MLIENLISVIKHADESATFNNKADKINIILRPKGQMLIAY